MSTCFTRRKKIVKFSKIYEKLPKVRQWYGKNHPDCGLEQNTRFNILQRQKGHNQGLSSDFSGL